MRNVRSVEKLDHQQFEATRRVTLVRRGVPSFL
jgi:hypothetical protein